MTVAAEERFTRESITWIHPWTPHLFSFRITRPRSYRFTAGQFARLGVEKPDGSIAWRAYSMVSGPYDDALEFYSIVVPDGEFTTQLARLRVGDTLLIEKQNHGFLTLSRFTQGRDLWLLSTHWHCTLSLHTGRSHRMGRLRQHRAGPQCARIR